MTGCGRWAKALWASEHDHMQACLHVVMGQGSAQRIPFVTLLAPA